MTEGLRQSQPGVFTRLRAWFSHHLQSLVFSLGKIYRSPLPTIMTVAVIAITLTLPAGFYLFLKNLERVSGDFRSSTQVSLYLKLETSDNDARALESSLKDNEDIADTSFISREQALNEFKQNSGFGESIEQLANNPLPHTIVVQPVHEIDPLRIKTLVSQLQADPRVDIAKLDTEWLERLYTIVDMARRSVIIISLLFSFAVLLTIGNTIRLDIQNRYQEIIVTKLIGATDAFIRRPFLYGGVWYGLFGGLLAWLLVELSALMLSGPVARLNQLYRANFELVTFNFTDFMILIAASTVLGLAGSWLAVARHLNDIEPK